MSCDLYIGPNAAEMLSLTEDSRVGSLREVVRRIEAMIRDRAKGGQYSMCFQVKGLEIPDGKMEREIISIFSGRGFNCGDHGYISWEPRDS